MVNRIWLLVGAVIVSFLLALGASWAVVVSQNPVSNVNGSATDYGPMP